MLATVGWRDDAPLRPALYAQFPLCASITGPTPHASHRTSVRWPLKGLGWASPEHRGAELAFGSYHRHL